MLIILALLAAPISTAALLSLLGPFDSYGRRFGFLCIAVGVTVLFGIAVVRGTTTGPTTDGLLHLKHSLRLVEGAEEAVPFELRRTTGYGCEVELHLDAALPTKRWKPLHELGGRSQGPPPVGLVVDWTVERDGTMIAKRTEPPTLRQHQGFTTDGALVGLGRFESRDRGTYEIRLHIKRVPAGLQGEHVELVIDSDIIAYKTARGRAGVRDMAHFLLAASTLVTMLLGLLAWRGQSSPRRTYEVVAS